MSLFRIMDIAGSALGAQTIRMNTTASNMANANSASSSIDQTYRARHPIFSTLVDDFAFDEDPSAGVKQMAVGFTSRSRATVPIHPPRHMIPK